MHQQLGQLRKEFGKALDSATIRNAFVSNGKDYARTRADLLKMTGSKNQPEFSKCRPVVVLRNKKHEEHKARHQKELAGLHSLRKLTKGTARTELEAAIDEKAIEWNKENRHDRNYYDLHGMTKDGAVSFVRRVVAEASLSRTPVIRLETGRGNHSRNNVPAIKTALLAELELIGGCSVAFEHRNDGVLVVSLHH